MPPTGEPRRPRSLRRSRIDHLKGDRVALREGVEFAIGVPLMVKVALGAGDETRSHDHLLGS